MSDELRQRAESALADEPATHLSEAWCYDIEHFHPQIILAGLDLADLVSKDLANGRCWPEAEAALAALNQETHA